MSGKVFSEDFSLHLFLVVILYLHPDTADVNADLAAALEPGLPPLNLSPIHMLYPEAFF